MTVLEDELRAALRTQAQALRVPERPILDRDNIQPRRPWEPRWLAAAACVALVAVGVVALAVRRGDEPEPAPPIASVVPATTTPDTSTPDNSVVADTTPATGAFVGIWFSTDTDGSSQTMEVVPSGPDEYKVVGRDEAATVACAGAASTMTGTGRLETDERLVIPQPVLTCDDGTTPAVGSPPQEEIAVLTFDRDASTDELVDSFGVVWRRQDPLGGDETASPATTEYVEQRSPGDEIVVTAALVDLGEGLVGLLSNMDRADGYTYVIAGRYETEADLDRYPPEEAVLAAFDDTGRELWRTELDGRPVDVVASTEPVNERLNGVWVLHSSPQATLSRFDASDGRFIDRVTIGGAGPVFAAFGSVWSYALDVDDGSGRLIQVHEDMSTTTIELPASIVDLDVGVQREPAVGAGGIWVPLGAAGVAMVAADTGQVTVISDGDIGHEAFKVAVDGDVVYVASRNRVSSIVDGDVVATVDLGEIRYLGRVDGVFGANSPQGFVTLRPVDPMEIEVRQVTAPGYLADEIDGNLWTEEGWNYDLRRVEFLPDSSEGG